MASATGVAPHRMTCGLGSTGSMNTSTTPRAQPPPTQPAMRPSAAITALAPGLAATAATVRTTVANTKGSPLALSSSASFVTSSAADIVLSSGPRQMRRQCRQALQVVRGREQVDMGQGGGHSTGDRLIALPTQQGIEPDDAA